MSKSQQRKGRRAELELAGILQGHGYDVRPGEPVSFGREPDVVGLPGIHCELKRRECVDCLPSRQPAAVAGHDGA